MGFAARVDVKEGAGAERHLRISLIEAAGPEQRRRLVSYLSTQSFMYIVRVEHGEPLNGSRSRHQWKEVTNDL